MNKKVLAIVLLVLFSIVAGSIIFIHFLGGNEDSVGKLHWFPLLAGEKTFIVTVLSNYSSTPEVYLPIIPANMIEFDFRGPPENSFWNITIPKDLIWGQLTVIDKYYEVDKTSYILSSNSTHTSIYYPFDSIALTKHFEIRGTEGAIT